MKGSKNRLIIQVILTISWIVFYFRFINDHIEVSRDASFGILFVGFGIWATIIVASNFLFNQISRMPFLPCWFIGCYKPNPDKQSRHQCNKCNSKYHTRWGRKFGGLGSYWVEYDKCPECGSYNVFTGHTNVGMTTISWAEKCEDCGYGYPKEVDREERKRQVIKKYSIPVGHRKWWENHGLNLINLKDPEDFEIIKEIEKDSKIGFIQNDDNQYERVVFHGACLGCKSQKLYGLKRCAGCFYFHFEGELPDLTIKN